MHKNNHWFTNELLRKIININTEYNLNKIKF